MEVFWTSVAEDDLSAIFEYIAKDDLQVAIEMDRLFRNKSKMLSKFPQLGKSGRVFGTREFVVHPNYILVYRILGNSIQILALLHGAKEYPPV